MFIRIFGQGFKALFLILLLSIFFILIISDAKIGYDIDVVVNNSTMSSHWSRSQSTEILKFNSSSVFKGEGSSTKYQKITGFAGLGLKETTYAREGQLNIEDELILASDERYIWINETGGNYSDQYLSDHYSIEINESLPTIIANKNEIFYVGDGINTRNTYINGENKVLTNYYGGRLSKLVTSISTYNNSLIRADVTPGRVVERILKDPVIFFNLRSFSDKYSGIGYISDESLLEERYLGTFRMETSINKNYAFNATNESEESAWLECCFSSNEYPADKMWSPEIIKFVQDE